MIVRYTLILFFSVLAACSSDGQQRNASFMDAAALELPDASDDVISCVDNQCPVDFESPTKCVDDDCVQICPESPRSVCNYGFAGDGPPECCEPEEQCCFVGFEREACVAGPCPDYDIDDHFDKTSS